MDTVEYNLDKICRACKGEAEELFSVFETEKTSGRPSKLADMLMACASVQVEHGDGLPGSICMQCVDQLSNAYTFKKQCEKTDTSLRLYIRQKDIGVKEENAVNNAEIDNILDFNSIYNNEVSTPDDSKTIKTEPVENVADDDRTLLCNICNKKFSSTNELKLHQQKHASVNIHKCKICSKEYFRLGHLQRHMVKHEPRRVHVCKLCNKTLTKVEHLKRHMITHVKNKPYGCETCRRGFNRPDHLMNHAKRCKGDKPFVCEICNKGFNREDSLQVHLSTHVAKVDMKPMLESLDNYEEHYVVVENYVGVSDLEEPDNCSDSDVISNVDWAEPEVNILEKPESESNITTLNQNIKYEEERLEENDGTNNDSKNEESDEESKPLLERIKTEVAVVSEVPIKRKRGRPRKTNVTPLKIIKSEKNGQENIMSIENKAKYPCDICDKVLSTLIGLEIHMRKHTGLKLFHCKVCNKKFTRSNHMKRHLLSHDEYKPFACDICQKKFTRHEHLIKHSKSHASEKKFECEVCFKLFGRVEQLEKHKAFKHNIGEKMPTEKKYKCTVCNKHFTTEKYRDTHQKAHSGERTFECKTCLKKFKSKSHLTEHTKFHNECSKKFLCSECGQRFIRNDYLVIHMRRHRGEKPFKCKYCGKGFPRTTDLTVHERYHTGEKTHLCMVCGRGFGRAYNLTVHMRTHTGEKPYQCTYCDAAFAQGNDLKAHVRRHTGERYHCDLCSEAFLMGYLLTQHKRTVHGVDVKSHIRRLHPSERVHLPNSQHNTQINVKPISSLTQLQGLHNTATLQAQAEVQDDLQQISLPTPPILPTISHSVSDAVA